MFLLKKKLLPLGGKQLKLYMRVFFDCKNNLELKTDKVIDKLGNYSSKLPVFII